VATLVELVFLLVTRTRGSWLAAACGLATVLWLVLVRQRVPRQVWLIVLGALVAGAVVAAIPAPANTRDVGDTKRYSSILTVLHQGLDVHSSALRTRVGFWRRSVGMLAEHPLLGVGPGNWPVIFPRFAEPGASEEGILSATLVPRQAHDDYVERATETGLLGMAALVALGVAAARATRKRLATDTPEARVATTGAAGALVALLALAPLSFPLEMPGTIALAGLALGLVVTDRDAADRPWGPALYLPSVAIGAALLVVVPLRAERQARGSKWIEAAEQALHANKGVPGAVAALEALDKARVALPPSYWVELRTAQMLLREKRNDEAIAAAKRVIGIEPYSPNGWGVLSVAYRAAGRPEDSKAAATRGLEIMHDYPLALDARADAEERLGDLAAAEADRARIRDIAEHAGDDATRNTARNLSRPPATSAR
jgi:O-antigen ligase